MKVLKNLFPISNSNFNQFRQVILAPRHNKISCTVPRVKNAGCVMMKSRYKDTVQKIIRLTEMWRKRCMSRNTATSAQPHFTERSSACPLAFSHSKLRIRTSPQLRKHHSAAALSWTLLGSFDWFHWYDLSASFPFFRLILISSACND